MALLVVPVEEIALRVQLGLQVEPEGHAILTPRAAVHQAGRLLAALAQMELPEGQGLCAEAGVAVAVACRVLRLADVAVTAVFPVAVVEGVAQRLLDQEGLAELARLDSARS